MNTVGIDIGGTFTDIAGLIGGRMFYAKAPSSPDVVTGVIEGVKLMLEKAGVDPSEAIEITHIHGTTIATNTLLEHKGAKVALLATRGHRDALELGRMKRTNLYDLHADAETPGFLIPRHLRVGIKERIGGRGQIEVALEEAEVIEKVGQLIDLFSIEACAVCYLNSYANPEHERRTAEIIDREFPQLYVSLSSDVNPIFREYERVCATAFDAYVRPKVVNYVRQLEDHLADEGGGKLHLMQSSGGIGSAKMTVEKPVSMFLSGPAAGVIGARHVGALSNRMNLIGFDVGGTSTDVCLVRDGQVQITKEGRIGRYPLRVPMVEMETVGSGGGSIAWVDVGGGLHVGPQSAGSVPGPACYSRGGQNATSTDASVVLGYVNPAYFANDTLPLDASLAQGAMARLGQQIGLDAEQTALGIHRILVSQMAEAIKLITVKRGVDPRKYTLVSFGGGGGLYAAAVARQLGMTEVLVPRSPGTLCAFGMIVSNFEAGSSRTVFIFDAAEGVPTEIEGIFGELEEVGRTRLRDEGLQGSDIHHRRIAEMRYAGQAYELDVPIAGVYGDAARSAALEAFHRIHHEVYGYSDAARRVEIVNVRVVSYQSASPLPEDALTRDFGEAATGSPFELRQAVFPEVGRVDTPIYRRADIPLGHSITGPAIIEQPDTTVVIGVGQAASHDSQGSLLIKC